MKVRCNNCMEVFDEKEIVYDGDLDKEFCPCCGEAGCLMDLLEDISDKKEICLINLNIRRLLEALVGYGDWGDESFPKDHKYLEDFLVTIDYKINCLKNIYNKGDNNAVLNNHLYDLGDVINFLEELKNQIKKEVK